MNSLLFSTIKLINKLSLETEPLFQIALEFMDTEHLLQFFLKELGYLQHNTTSNNNNTLNQLRTINTALDVFKKKDDCIAEYPLLNIL